MHACKDEARLLTYQPWDTIFEYGTNRHALSVCQLQKLKENFNLKNNRPINVNRLLSSDVVCYKATPSVRHHH